MPPFYSTNTERYDRFQVCDFSNFVSSSYTTKIIQIKVNKWKIGHKIGSVFIVIFTLLPYINYTNIYLFDFGVAFGSLQSKLKQTNM